MTYCDDEVLLVPEVAPIKTERKGCATNLILIALFLEAARMVDDGFETIDIEAAAQKAFGIPKGFLAQMDEIGIVKTVAAMKGRNAALMANHGAVCVGRDLEQAILCCEILEKACRSFIEAEFLGGAKEINRFEAWIMHQYYLKKYSKKT